MELPEDAPVKATGEIRIKASPEDVWEVLTDFESWPEWFPGVKSMAVDGPVAPGTTFHWKAGPSNIVSVIEEVDEDRLIAWRGRMGGIRAVHIWHLEPDGDRTLVRTEESWDGFLPRAMRRKSRKMLNRAVTGGVRALRDRVNSLRR